MSGRSKKMILGGIVWFLMPFALFAQNTARTEAIFPFFIERQIPLAPGDFTPVDSFHSWFEILNPNPSTAVVTFHVFDAAGQESFPAGGQPLTRTIEAYGTGLAAITYFASGVKSVIGWLRVSATQPVIIQQQILHAEESRFGPPTRRDISSVFKFPATATRMEVVRVYSVPSAGPFPPLWSNTGISIAFPASPSAAPARGTLTLRYVNGTKFAETTVTVPPNGQIVRLFSEWFPQIPGAGISGTLELLFDQDVFITAIQMTIQGSKETMEPPTSGKIFLGAFGQ
ncbi:MAG: hypothetical protein ACR2L2_15775 [Acidobacteriota bacterium]